MLAQLKNAGIPASTADAYAGLYEAAIGTIAERAGVDPVALYERYGLKVERPELIQAEKAQETAQAPPGEATDVSQQTDDRGQKLGEGATAGPPVGQPERRTSQQGPPAGQAERRQQLDRPIDVMSNVGEAAVQMIREGIKPGTGGARAVFLAHGPEGPLYNIIGGRSDRSTATAEGLTAQGIPIPETPPDTGERLSGAQIRERMLASQKLAEAPEPVLEATPAPQASLSEGFRAEIAELKAKRDAWAKQVAERFASQGSVRTTNKSGVVHLVHESTREPGRIQITSFDENGEPSGHITVDSIAEAAKELTGDTIIGETGAPDAGGSQESGYADRLRDARERGVPASYPREREKPAQRAERRQRHYDAAFADLLDAARSLVPDVDEQELRGNLISASTPWRPAYRMSARAATTPPTCCAPSPATAA
jgi:hypothetical protein